MERLGFGYEDVRKIKPDIVYLAMPMYGETGPRASMVGLGMTISAVTGMTWLTGHENGPPIGAGTHFPTTPPIPITRPSRSWRRSAIAGRPGAG